MSSSAPLREFPATFATLPALLTLAGAAASAAGLCPHVTRHVELVLEEALSNTIRHGYGGESAARRVWLSCELRPDGLGIVYQDAAPPFDPLNAAAPPSGDHVGGIGCVLIRTLPKHAEYRLIDGRNTLLLDFRQRV